MLSHEARRHVIEGGGWGRLWAHRVTGAHLLAAETRLSQVTLQRGLLQQPPDLGLASSLSHLDAPGLDSWRLGREESLSLPHCGKLGCRDEGVCSFPTVPQAPIDGRIAGE